jgi:hypothetical protein
MQGILWHSTITLTMDRYTHPFKNDQAEGIAKLPDLSELGREATGTDGTELSSSGWASCWASRVRKYAITGDTMRQESSQTRNDEREEKPLFTREKPKKQGLKSGGGGIRTHGTANRTPVFKTGPFDHSGTPPGASRRGESALYRV